MVFAFFWACCGQRPHGETKSAASDGGPTKEVRKDGERTEAPRHGTPEPEKLDSLKQEKAKEKGPSAPGKD
ncbi:MAG: hypothetical protein IPK99_05310 [Flavobacteriales bacterium]|nr:hypothetical protein [Flavobacteriales bacterium]